MVDIELTEFFLLAPQSVPESARKRFNLLLHRSEMYLTNSTLVSRATYASQAWWGMISMGCRERLQATFKKVIKQGLLPANHRSFSEICDTADRVLFASVLSNPCHSLHHLLPPKRRTKYDLRKRAHDWEIPLTENSVMKKTFIIKMLYLNSY